MGETIDAPPSAEETAFRAGYLAGSYAEWRAAAEAVRLAVHCQAREGREVLTGALNALGLGDLLAGTSPCMTDEDAAEAWAAWQAGRDQHNPLPPVSDQA